MAVVKDPRNIVRIRVTCRDEAELQWVKEAAQKSLVTGTRVLQDQLYPVKIDNANRTAHPRPGRSSSARGNGRAGKGERSSRNQDGMALSRKDTGKAYGSMAVYLIKGSDAARLQQGQYFHISGESAYTGPT